MKKIHVLCPEYIPLENKGEEAIIKGTIDVVFPNNECVYHIIDNNTKTYYYKNNLHVHPGALFFSDWRSREFSLGLSFSELYSSVCSLIRNGLNLFFPFWISRPHIQAVRLRQYLDGSKGIPKNYLKSVSLLKKVDYIIAGHNGGLDEYVCHILDEMFKIGIPYGIFGSSMKPKVTSKVLLKIYKKTFKKSQFNIARNPIGYDWAVSNFPSIKFELEPDPAFGMLPVKSNDVDDIIKKKNLSQLFDKPVIMVTTAEPAPIIRNAFINSSDKRESHRRFLTSFIQLIIDKMDVSILFLPHTIGPTLKMDDRLISVDVLERLGDVGPNVRVLNDDLTSRELKGLISRGDFLIAERLHSIIGAIGVATPFMSLASDADLRIEGILKKQLKLQEFIYSLSNPFPQDAFLLFEKLYNNRYDLTNTLIHLNKKITNDLMAVGDIIRKTVETSIVK